jgi:Tfp pilus assembly protein PilF
MTKDELIERLAELVVDCGRSAAHEIRVELGMHEIYPNDYEKAQQLLKEKLGCE